MPKRPDITPVAESLLSRVSEGYNKRSSSNDIGKAFLLELGVGLANRAINKRAEDFMSNEAIMAETVRQKQFATKSAAILKMEQEMLDKKISVNKYYSDQYMAQAEPAFKEKYGDGYVAYKDTLRTEANKWAEERAKEYKEALAMARKGRPADLSPEGLKKILDRPTNIASAVGEGVFNFFSGQSKEDVARQGVENIRKKGYIKNESFEEVFNTVLESDGADRAYEFIQDLDVKGLKSSDVVTIEADPRVLGKDLVVTKIAKKTDQYGNESMVGNISTVTVIDGETGETTAEALKTAKSTFNVAKDGEDKLTRDAWAKYLKMSEDRGINPLVPSSMKEYLASVSLYMDFANNPTNLVDDQLDTLKIEALKEALRSQDLTKLGEEGAPEETIARYLSTLGTIQSFSELLKVKAVEPPAPVIIDLTDDED